MALAAWALFVQEEQDEVVEVRGVVLNWSAEPGTEPGLVSADGQRVTLCCTPRVAACLLQEKTEAVGVLLDGHLQEPWVFPPAMPHRGSEGGSAGAGPAILVLSAAFLFTWDQTSLA